MAGDHVCHLSGDGGVGGEVKAAVTSCVGVVLMTQRGEDQM